MIRVGKKCLYGLQPLPTNINLPKADKIKVRMRSTDLVKFYIKQGGKVWVYTPVADTFAGPWDLEPLGENITL